MTLFLLLKGMYKTIGSLPHFGHRFKSSNPRVLQFNPRGRAGPLLAFGTRKPVHSADYKVEGWKEEVEKG
jgi:hypothetical protein